MEKYSLTPLNNAKYWVMSEVTSEQIQIRKAKINVIPPKSMKTNKNPYEKLTMRFRKIRNFKF